MMLGCEGFWVGADEGKGGMLVWENIGFGSMLIWGRCQANRCCKALD